MNERDYSYFSHCHKAYSRIDLFLVDKQLLFKCKSAKIHGIAWSDHAPVELVVEGMSNHKHTYMWKANPRLFQHGPTKTYVEHQLKEFFLINQESVSNPFSLWNAHKAFVRGILIQQGARVRRMRQQHTTRIINQIDLLEKQNMINTSTSLIDQITKLRTELRLLLLEDFEKATRKLKLSYYTCGNRAGKLLAQQLRGHRYKTHIQHIIQTQIKHQHPQDIADAFSHYYSSLYNLKTTLLFPNQHLTL